MRIEHAVNDRQRAFGVGIHAFVLADFLAHGLLILWGDLPAPARDFVHRDSAEAELRESAGLQVVGQHGFTGARHTHQRQQPGLHITAEFGGLGAG